jgi:hypothetical protein
LVGLSNNKIWDNEVEMKKIFALCEALKIAGYESSEEVRSLMKLADSRGNMIRLLGLDREAADYFHNLSGKKSYDIARWFVEWKGLDRSAFADKKTFHEKLNYFFRNLSISSEDDFVNHNFIEEVLESDSLYQKTKNKRLVEIMGWGEDNGDNSIFELYILQKYEPGNLVQKVDEEWTWYNVGQNCSVVSAFLKNCGSIGDLDEDGDYGEYSDFSIYALKNRLNKPVMIVTAGHAYVPEYGSYEKVIINVSITANRRPDDGFRLDKLKEFADGGGYIFANLNFVDKWRDDKIKQIYQSPGLDDEFVSKLGGILHQAYIGEDPEDAFEESSEE